MKAAGAPELARSEAGYRSAVIELPLGLTLSGPVRPRRDGHVSSVSSLRATAKIMRKTVS